MIIDCLGLPKTIRKVILIVLIFALGIIPLEETRSPP